MAKSNVKPPTTKITKDYLRLWTENHMNVLLISRHGVGKTSLTRDFWENDMGWKEGETYKYLSASTLDPWVDIVGIPTPSGDNDNLNISQLLKIFAIQERIASGEVGKDEMQKILGTKDSGPPTIDFLQPAWLHKVHAIFVDELNRSHPKVRNALMEFIQFKSVNGRPLPNLQMVWGAINPDDDDEMNYDVERLDPATYDRFHLHIFLPNEPNYVWFAKEFGDDLAAAVIEWYKVQVKAIPEIADAITPRRLEYVIRYVKMQGDIRHVIPDAIALGADYRSLSRAIRTSSPVRKKMREIFESKDTIAAKEFFADENNYTYCIGDVIRTGDYMRFFMPILPPEKISDLFYSQRSVQNHILQAAATVAIFRQIVEDIHDTTGDSVLRTKIGRSIFAVEKEKALPSNVTINPQKAMYVGGMTNNSLTVFGELVRQCKTKNLDNTYERVSAFASIKRYMPDINTSLTPALAAELLEAFEKQVIGRSQVKKVAREDVPNGKWDGAIGIINRAIDSLPNYKPADFASDYPRLFDLARLARDKFYFVL